jgi:hypothetical protein
VEGDLNVAVFAATQDSQVEGDLRALAGCSGQLLSITISVNFNKKFQQN